MKKILKLIDESNRPLMYLKGKYIKHPSSKVAEEKLFEMGIYDVDGVLITKNENILRYYESKWC